MIEKVKSKPLRHLLTGLKIVGKSLLLLPIPVAMAFANYTIDVSGVFHGDQFEKDIARAMVENEPVDNYDRMDERGVLSQLANSLQTPYDTLAFGSSRVLQLRSEIADGGSYFNCGVSAGDFVDFLGLYYTFEKAGMAPKNVILELDPWLLSRYSYDRQPKSDKNLYNEFLHEKLGYDVSYETEVQDNGKYKILFSPSYLQGNLDAYFNGGDTYAPPAVVNGDYNAYPTNIKLPDGSVFYMASFRAAKPEEIEERARNQAMEFLWMDEFYELDPELCEIFDRYVQYLQNQGMNVIFLLTPYHPTVYNNAMEYSDLYSGFFATEPFYVKYAQKHNIPIYGSYNPFVTGTLEEDFYDGLHMTDKAIESFFPGVQAALRQQPQGMASSPWLHGRVPVEVPIAQRIVAQRYEIPQGETLRREEDETIEGADSYVFGRYGTGTAGENEKNGKGEAAKEICLARYAVCKSTGMIYRFDTDAGQWTVDRRALRG